MKVISKQFVLTTVVFTVVLSLLVINNTVYAQSYDFVTLTTCT